MFLAVPQALIPFLRGGPRQLLSYTIGTVLLFRVDDILLCLASLSSQHSSYVLQAFLELQILLSSFAVLDAVLEPLAPLIAHVRASKSRLLIT